MCWHRAWKASSHRWHPRSVDIAIRTLRYLVRNEKRLLRAVSNMSEYFRTRLGAMRFAGDAEIRVVGLAIGIDLHDEKAAERLGKRCRRKGLLVSPVTLRTRVPCRRPYEAPARTWERKNRTISAEASGPVGSVNDPLRLPPDHACPAPCTTQCSTTAWLAGSR